MSTTPFTEHPAPLPEELSAPLEKLVYFYVRQADGATVYQLRDALDVTQLRLYPTIDRLTEAGLVVRDGEEVRPLAPPLA